MAAKCALATFTPNYKAIDLALGNPDFPVQEEIYATSFSKFVLKVSQQ